jgi:hypothetical protein
MNEGLNKTSRVDGAAIRERVEADLAQQFDATDDD